MRNLLSIVFLFLGLLGQAQINSQTSERFPVFPDCQSQEDTNLETCFYNQVHDFVFNNFKVPEDLTNKNYKGTVIVLFEVTDEGKFIVQYVDANEKELVEESKRVFAKMPKVSPATYNGKPTYAKYTIRIAIPLQSREQIQAEKDAAAEAAKSSNAFVKNTKELNEYEAVKYQTFDQPQFESHNNIPFSHSYYAQFDDELNQVGANNHTSSKPYNYAEVNKYYNFKDVAKSIEKPRTSWLGKKFWNENMVELKGEDYWFTLNPIVDLQLGRSQSNISDNSNSTFINTRGIQFNGGLGKTVNFTTTLYESQGRFAGYFNRYAESIKPDGGNPAIIPGIGIAKRFKDDAYDFPLAEANLAFTPSNFFNLNLGYGRNFLGDGYRSLLLSDGASPYPYVKINTSFWKIKYTNIYTWLKDVRPEVTIDRTYATKYVASHYLSMNVSKRWNLGFFESVVWTNQNNRGFDMSFVNPIIFYRAVEFASSSRSGNALLGLTTKYKFSNQVNFYGQFLLDEFSLNDVKAGEKSWKNKFGYQLGAKYYNAFNIKNLLLQVEYNHVRPYVYAHSEPITNYGHNNQSLGHNWGGNFKEFVAIARYFKGRYFADAKITFGQRGLDFNTADDNFNYGGNIYLDYDVDRPYDTGVSVGQGNKTTIFIADLQAGYLINPSTNMKLFGSLIFRNFSPTAETLTTFKENTTWFSLGLRCDIFNWYFDY
ncbi:gliding motility protein RemB [Flavobacterium capsici]|uniref:Gliding motility protein RemB n=1 Tax=Flavobacterium capsici TaxID=3075618 RepID=A0AA96EY29_9FLAO|nr:MULTISPECIES: gliding motility protein RemB [unclassified Flavobacterium]WNM19343.1 gliding motility protein RemB [Flavobacterium sp. PMR2A8]WNM20732.1 gliding motility protein RemB [Flavobacterium sp. PMTSA4]